MIQDTKGDFLLIMFMVVALVTLVGLQSLMAHLVPGISQKLEVSSCLLTLAGLQSLMAQVAPGMSQKLEVSSWLLYITHHLSG